MAILTLREHLIVDYPGEALEALKTLATFERIGRLRNNQKRVVENFATRGGGQRILLPRGLAAKAAKILPGSAIRDERFVTRPVHFGLRVNFRDYQEQAVQAVVQRGGGVIVSAPGSGKTIMGLGLVSEWQQPALFLVHTLRLVDQTVAKAREVLTLPRGGLGIIADGRKSIGSHLTIATVQTLAKKPRYIAELRQRVGTVIQDECVVGNTLIDGRPIRDFKVGDTVWAYDETRSVWAQKAVTHIFTKPAPSYLIDVQTANQRLVCTANHPIWTQRGWVDAGRLVTGDQVLTQGDTWERVNFLWVLEPDDPAYWEACPDGQVYNLEVADFHTFVANGMVTHNCHHSPSVSFQKVINAFPARFRGALTATPDREDGLGPLINALFGPSVIIPRDVLRARGVIIDPVIYLVHTHWDAPDEVPFHEAEAERAAAPPRNVVILKLVFLALVRHPCTVLSGLCSHSGIGSADLGGGVLAPRAKRWASRDTDSARFGLRPC